MFEYYRGSESEQFSFYRVPRLLLKHPRFKGLSAEAKLLYGMLLDRMSLSARNGWRDSKDRVYIYYTLEEIKEDLGCGTGTAVKLLAALDEKKGYGLIRRVKQGLGRPDMIYVRNIARMCDEPESQDFQKVEVLTADQPAMEACASKKRNSGLPNFETQDLQNLEANNIENNYTEGNQSVDPSSDSDRLTDSDLSEVEEDVKEQIQYDALCEAHPDQEALIDSIVDLVAEARLAPGPLIRVGKEERPAELVRARFSRLDYISVEAVLDNLREVRQIRNPRAYLMTALWNAPTFAESAARYKNARTFGFDEPRETGHTRFDTDASLDALSSFGLPPNWEL